MGEDTVELPGCLSSVEAGGSRETGAAPLRRTELSEDTGQH